MRTLRDEISNAKNEGSSEFIDGRLLKINPTDELPFQSEEGQDACATITLTNSTTKCVAFKVKTTSPEKYRVRPSSGIIRPHCQCEVIVQLQSLYKTTSLSRDKFLVMAISVETSVLTNQELSDIWRTTPKERIMEYKLRCTLLVTNGPILTHRQNNKTTFGEVQPLPTNQQIEALNSKVEALQMELYHLRRLIMLVIGILFAFLIMLIMMILFGADLTVKRTIVNSYIAPNLA